MNRTFIEPLEARIAPAFAAAINLGALSAADGFKLSGLVDSDYAGGAVSGAGDVNGDGIDDLIIGASGSAGGGTSRGASYVVFGKVGGSGSVDLGALDGTAGFTIVGTDNEFSGQEVAAAGDVNGDGFDDLLIGTSTVNSRFGAAYVVFGKAAGFPAALPLSSLDGGNGFTIPGEFIYNLVGVSLSRAGDVNGDGFDDIIVGAAADNVNSPSDAFGESYVVFGKASGFSPTLPPSELNGTNGFKITGVAIADQADRVSGAGDVNGDGFDDLIIGARSADEGGSNRGAAYVVFGKANGFAANLIPSTLNGTNGFKLTGVANGDSAGSAVSGAGDVNGDGFADLILSAAFADEGGTDRGAAYVVFGAAGGFGASVALSGINGSNGFKVSGLANEDNLGFSVQGAGDVNGDGFADVIIGASTPAEGGTDRGAAYVVFGKAGGFSVSLSVAALNGANGFKLSGVADGDFAGAAVSGVGDVNGDGFGDLIVGASRADEGGTSRGAAYVIFGQPQVKVNFLAGGKTAVFPDSDGDLVTLKVSKGTLSQRDFTFSALGVLQKLDLATKGSLVFGGTSVTATVKKVGAGDGKFHLGALDARGLDLGTVALPGDLGQLDAGDANFKTLSVKALTVDTLGVLTTTQPTSDLPIFRSDITGPLGVLTVKGDMRGELNVTGGTGANIGSVSIGRDLNGDLSVGGYTSSLGLIRATGNIGAVTVKGSILGGENTSGLIAGGKLGKVSVGVDIVGKSELAFVRISALGDVNATTAAKAIAIASVTVKRDVENARIVAGYTPSIDAANPNASIGAVSVGRDWTASSIAAGVDDGFVLFGLGLADTLIAGDTQPALLATIASVTIKGTATGSTPVGLVHYGIVAERVVKLKIGATTIALNNTANDLLLDPVNNDFRVLDFA